MFCTYGDNESKERELSCLKQVIEKLISVQPGYEEPFDPKCIFFIAFSTVIIMSLYLVMYQLKMFLWYLDSKRIRRVLTCF